MTEARPAWRRAALTLLNIVAPGAGLLRTGRPKLALAFLLAPTLLLALLLLFYALTPVLTPAAYAAIFILLSVTVLALVGGSMILTWRAGRFRAQAGRWWSRWYGLLLAITATLVSVNLLQSAAHRFYKPFYLPSEGMAPTLLKGDRFLAEMGPVPAPRRGEIILFPVGRGNYVQRVAGLPGDRIALRGGIVLLNGQPVPQRLVGEEERETLGAAGTVRRLLEQFPGERRAHMIYDSGVSEVDHMPEQIVAQGHVFVLGDNRDRSADSRLPRAMMGVEQLPIDDIIGRALFITWGPEGRIGEYLD